MTPHKRPVSAESTYPKGRPEVLKRRALKPWEKAIVRKRQGNLCPDCKKDLGGSPVEYDHVLSLALGGGNDLDNFAAVHKRPCHQARTAKTVAMKSKADRVRTYHETGHGRKHKRSVWSWLNFKGERKTSEKKRNG